MKKKTVAVTTIFFAFFGFAWLVETEDRFNRGIIETEDPTSMNIRPVQYGETEEVEEEMTKEPVPMRQPFKSREYIRVVPHSQFQQ
ncbi:hypothetical protein CN378_01235 [Bacillus sp. AFS015802]|uniref:hypothetical protein n=1 Tax=Bacillus sp. AFS015802 TaxID=2033486 RepID=UPI000BF41531|nr:hypothetical protein [Bacillus sp. AFS015802]PFA70439.1 hypothetical protein CN378_01235 [Bacillus sp. AFS015802]